MGSSPPLDEEALDFSPFPPEEEEEDVFGLSRPLEGEPGGEDDFLLEEEVDVDDEPFVFPSSFVGLSFFGEGFLGNFFASVLGFTGSRDCLESPFSLPALGAEEPPPKEWDDSLDHPPSLSRRRNDRSRQVGPTNE